VPGRIDRRVLAGMIADQFDVAPESARDPLGCYGRTIINGVPWRLSGCGVPTVLDQSCSMSEGGGGGIGVSEFDPKDAPGLTSFS